jgi:hypothetical protein
MAVEKLAEFGLDAGAQFLNNSLSNIIDTDTKPDNIDDNDLFSDNDDVDDLDKSTTDQDTVQNTVQDDDLDNEENDPPTDVNTDVDDDDPYKDYSDTALYALGLKQINPALINFDVNKDLNPEDFIKQLEETFESKLISAKEELSEQYEGAAKYIDYLLEDGMDPEIVKQGIELHKISSIEITEDTTEKELVDICKKGLILKGTTNQDDIDDFIETWKDKDKLFNKAQEFIKLHKNYEETLFEKEKERREKEQEAFVKAQEQEKKEVKSIIDKGLVRGITIKDRNKLYDAIYKPTEIVQYKDRAGKTQVTKTTLYQKLYNDFNDDKEQQIAFAYLLMEGFDFTKIVDVAKQQVNKDVLDVLNNKKNRTNNTNKQNGWAI